MLDILNSWFGLVASVLTGIGVLIGFFKWLILHISLSKSPKQVIVKDGNLFGVLTDGSQRQLTFSGSDSNPILIKKKRKVVFLRAEEIKSHQNYTRYKFLVLDLKNHEEKVLVDQKPFLDGLDRSSEILSPIGMKLSPDQSKVLFVVEKYVTSGQLVQVDIKTHEFIELFPAEFFEFILSGKYSGNLLVGVSEIRDKGRDIHYHIYDWKGKSLYLFESEEEYRVFRSKALVRK